MVKKNEIKITVFYYSGTGNSFYVAKKIVENFQEGKLVSITTTMDRKIECDSKIIGIVFPIHGKYVPPIVFDFIFGIKMTNDPYVFAIATYGGFSGKTLSVIDAIISENGYELSYGNKILMPANCVISYPLINKSEKTYQKIEKHINKICDDLKLKKEKKIKKKIKLKEKHLMFVLRKKEKYLQRGKLFYSTDSCTKCEKCVKLCPVANIKMGDGKVHFLEKCILCMACINWCPQQAINWEGKTEKRNRYTNPNISYKEFVRRNLFF